jgi:peptide chain release factor 1
MFNRLEAIERRYEELNELIASPELTTNPSRLQTLAQEQANLEEAVNKYRQYKAISEAIQETQDMQEEKLDPDLAFLAKEELNNLREQQQKIIHELKLALLPKDTNESKSAIVEIRAGTGGDEASLFAADLYRMYNRYSQSKNWQVELINCNQSDVGGFKEVIFEVNGKGAFSRLKHERGVHRVQRVPTTEASGRIHTSTATVAVLPEAKEVDIGINPEDISFSGVGGLVGKM